MKKVTCPKCNSSKNQKLYYSTLKGKEHICKECFHNFKIKKRGEA